MTTYRLTFVPGADAARLLPAPRNWFKVPGVYAQVDREKTVHYIVNGEVSLCTEAEAHAAALAALPAVEQVANDVLAEVRPAAGSVRVAEPVARHAATALAPTPTTSYPTALSCLVACGAEFPVIAETVHRAHGTTTAGWRHIVRQDLNHVLHIATDAYEIIPQRDALSLLDDAAAEGRIAYTLSWVSTEQQRIRPIGDEAGRNVEIVGRRVGISFRLPSVESKAFASVVVAGGTLLTSHDGSTAIRATACLTFGDVTVFHIHTDSWRHTSKAAERIQNSREALDYLTRAAAGLVRDAEATVNVPDDEAATVVLRTIRPDLFASIDLAAFPVANDYATAVAKQTKARERALSRLHDRAQTFTSPEAGVYLGGFRYVLAAPFAISNRVAAASYYDGTARERMTKALIALATHAGVREAGLVPAAVVS